MSSLSLGLSAEEKLVRARIQLQKEKPFFSYLTMHLTFIETPDMLKNSPGGIGVDKYGNLYFDPEYIDTLSDEQIKGVLAHEVMHCALEHLERLGNREHFLFNVANDIVVNHMLIKDGMQLPRDGINPYGDSIEFFGIKIKKIGDKTSEEVYDKLFRGLSKQWKKNKKRIQKYLDEQEKQGNGGFDQHMYGEKEQDKSKCPVCGGSGKDKDGNDCPRCSNKKNQQSNGGKVPTNMKNKDWKKILVDASSHARQRGNLPAGMERIVGKLLETYIDWRGLLYRYITSQIPVDYTWARPSKRSHSLGIYLPAVEKEMIEVMVAVDTSGSISQKELAEFISEISSIVNSFKNVDLTVIDCDCRVNGIHELRNASVSEVIHKIGAKLRGGGGTSHIPVFDWINKNKPTARFVIAFTDGYTEFPPQEDVKQPVLWVVAGNWRADKDNFPYGKVIELPKDD